MHRSLYFSFVMTRIWLGCFGHSNRNKTLSTYAKRIIYFKITRVPYQIPEQQLKTGY